MSRIFIAIITLYQRTLSPALASLGGGCRFHPSCSEYAKESFSVLPWWLALYRTAVRLLKCGPWHHGGLDPVRPR